MICEYGCGREATYQFKNGKWCCERVTSLCPFIRSKNNIHLKGTTQKPRSEETKLKISKSLKGRVLSKEVNEKISKGLCDRPRRERRSFELI